MTILKTVLVVDDSVVNRTILSKILSKDYLVLEAENGQIALDILKKHVEDIVAIMLDLTMPVMDGYAVLETLHGNTSYSNLPILVTTDNSNQDSEIKALALGAWDFISKPYNLEIIMFRLKNAIDRSQLSALKQLQYLSEYDALTGIYNKSKFFEATRELLDNNTGEIFVFLRFDVDRFQLINSFFGSDEGDKLLIYLAKHLGNAANRIEKVTYGRIESDVFGCCVPYNPITIGPMIEQSKETLARYNPNYDIVPSLGIYIIEDSTISVEEMCNRATLAAKTCKGNYIKFYAYYNESMSVDLSNEQEITNDMKFALKNGEFQIYLQPQYNIHTNLPCGAEALVRWMHPVKGMLTPDKFISVFERNGFITKLDYYVWEQACKCLHNWKLQGIQPYPLSVNVSRVNIYNPKLTEILLSLVNQYQLEPELLNLELTESAYTDNPIAMKKAMTQLQSHGFIIMMDDFGSGYSSLSLLKEIMIDVLKIDMRFLTKTDVTGRGENIIASVIRMAKWLKIPVIAEGAETAEQVDFLRSVGCDYVQGYYFARPMPVCEYEKLCKHLLLNSNILNNLKYKNNQYDDVFNFNTEMKHLFSNVLQPVAIYEFVDDQIELIRVNEAYYALLGHEDMMAKAPDILIVVKEAYHIPLLNAFRTCTQKHKTVECEYVRQRANGISIWIHTKLYYGSMVGKKHVVIGELNDITMRKELDSELKKYREAWMSSSYETNTVLIVDDAEINRTILKKILKDKFLFLEASNGEEAIKILQEKQNQVNLILLDISMPVMDGNEFLQYKKSQPKFDGIPVIMITADNSPEQQISTFSMGANDYIVKPFISEVVTQRVKNVLESNYRFKQMVKEYNTMSEQVKTDLMTGLINRVSAEKMISQRLMLTTSTCSLMMLDIDNFKTINDSYGHDYGDKVIGAVADRLRSFFRKEDIVARMGGDEFAVFVEDIPDIELVKNKAHQLGTSMLDIQIEGENKEITCSMGIAISSKEFHSFDALYQNADKALYNAKCHGRNTVSVYGEETVATSIVKWINDAESILDAINDSIYACDIDSYEMIYVNANLCKFLGVTLDECKGRKCYDILMHQSKPCEICSLSKSSEDKVYTRLFQIPNTSQIFLLRGKNINYNGKIAHLEVAIDVTKIENMDSDWKETTDYGQI
ncbi:MAG: EAL domain-containing protein [Lachnospiraceae bacterium]